MFRNSCSHLFIQYRSQEGVERTAEKQSEFLLRQITVHFKVTSYSSCKGFMFANLSLFSSLSFVVAASRAVRGISRTLALAAAIVFVFSALEVEAFDWLLEDSLTAVSSCGSAFDDTSSSGTRCLLGSGLNLMLKKGMDSANEYGKKAFGENFRFFGDLTHQSGTGL